VGGIRLAAAPKPDLRAVERSLFVDKVRDIVGLYLSPPNRALVLSIDEKGQIQALDREQPVLPNGQGNQEPASAAFWGVYKITPGGSPQLLLRQRSSFLLELKAGEQVHVARHATDLGFAQAIPLRAALEAPP
jgi:hypothetical protein